MHHQAMRLDRYTVKAHRCHINSHYYKVFSVLDYKQDLLGMNFRL